MDRPRRGDRGHRHRAAGGALIAGFLDWVAGLPAAAIYAVLAATCLFEPVLPPLPADVAVALAAFLVERGVTDAVTVWLVASVANAVGCLGVVLAARRLGRAFLATRLGRRLVSPEAIEVIERDYLRFGTLGVGVAKLLPGVRAVAPVFAGIFGIPAGRATLALGVAGALWYAGLTFLGVRLGSSWDDIERVLSQVNLTLGIVGALLLAGIGTWLYLRRQRRVPSPAAAQALDDEPGLDPREAARLVLELAYADPALTEAERDEVSRDLRARWGLAPEPAAGEAMPAPAEASEGALRALGGRLRARMGHQARTGLVERMWQAAFAEGAIGAHEAWLLRRAGELLGLTDDEVRQVRARLARAPDPAP